MDLIQSSCKTKLPPGLVGGGSQWRIAIWSSSRQLERERRLVLEEHDQGRVFHRERHAGLVGRRRRSVAGLLTEASPGAGKRPCLELGLAQYDAVIDQVVPVCSTRGVYGEPRANIVRA
jgi:hypothetical protein